MTVEIPSGWYPDPEGKPCERFWDGTQWTESYRALVQEPPPPPPLQPAIPVVPAAPEPTFSGNRRTPILVVTAAVVVAIGMVMAVAIWPTSSSNADLKDFVATITDTVPECMGNWSARGPQVVGEDMSRESEFQTELYGDILWDVSCFNSEDETYVSGFLVPNTTAHCAYVEENADAVEFLANGTLVAAQGDGFVFLRDGSPVPRTDELRSALPGFEAWSVSRVCS